MILVVEKTTRGRERTVRSVRLRSLRRRWKPRHRLASRERTVRSVRLRSFRSSRSGWKTDSGTGFGRISSNGPGGAFEFVQSFVGTHPGEFLPLDALSRRAPVYVCDRPSISAPLRPDCGIRTQDTVRSRKRPRVNCPGLFWVKSRDWSWFFRAVRAGPLPRCS